MQRHRLALVAVLSVAPGHQVSRDRAVALLWPESDDQQGRTLLNTTVHALRRALGADAIQSVGDALYLNSDRVDCDAIRIEQHRVAGRLDEAVAEYTGPFLDGFHLPDSPPFEEWLGQTREQLSSVHAKSLERLAMAAAGKGDTLGAVRWWTAFTRHLPFSQLGATNLVTALAAAGERAEAIAAGEQFATRLRAELEVEPDEELLRLLARLRADWVAAPVEPDTRPAAAAALPPESTDSAPSLGQHALTSIAPALDVEATSEVAATHRQPARGTRGRVRALTLAAAALVVFALAATMWPTRSGDGVVSDDVVLLAPFEYEGPPALSYLGEGIIDLIAAQLSSQTQFRTVLSRPFIAGISAGAFPNSAARLDEVRHAAREVGARRMIVGTIKLAGNVLALSASIVRTNTPLPEQPDAEISGSQDSLLVLTDRLAAQLLVGQVANLADATPGMLSARSLVAIEPYLRGRAAYRRGEWAGAAAHFQHALETDSTFAQAALGLALAENFGGNTARWNWAMNTLQAQQGQLNRVEFLMWDALIGRALPRRKAGWTEVTVLSPDQPEGWYELGDVEYHWGSLLGDADPLRSAFDHFSRALRTDPGFAPALSHIVELLAGNRETGRLRQWADRYFSQVKSPDRTHAALGWMVAVALGDTAWADTVRANFSAFDRGELRRVARLAQAFDLPLTDADSALRLLVQTAQNADAWRAAMIERWVFETNIGHLQRADSILGAIQDRDPTSLATRELAVLSYLYGEGSRPRAEASMRFVRQGLTSASETDRWLATCTNAWWDGFHARSAAAHSVAGDLMTPVLKPDRRAREFGTDNEVCARTIRAIADGAAGAIDTTSSLRDLDAYLAGSGVSRMRSEAASLEAVRLFVARGDLTRATTAVRRRQHLQQEPFLLATQLLRRARLARQTGATKEAIAAYRHYLRLRRNAEPGPAADAARVATEELAALVRER